MKRIESLKRILPVLLLFFASSVPAALFVFGDSLSDAGNVYDESIALGLNPDPIVPPYFMGRMSNGPNWADIVSQSLGLGLTTPNRLGGNNYAWAGATSAAGTTNRPSIVWPGQVQPVDNVGKQIQTFAAGHPGGFASSDLVLYWAGANDIFYYTIGGVPVGTAVATLLSLTATNLQSLEALGATEIVLPNQIDAGIAPAWNGMFGLPPAARPYITAVTTQFNAALPGLIANLEAMAGFDADITLVDAFSVAQSMFTNPAAYGFTNVTDPAFPAHVGDAQHYLFWDPIHPTTVAHRVIANAALIAVPEPGVLPLVGLGLSMLAYFGIGRRTPTSRQWQHHDLLICRSPG